jgi:hypothetical protein
LWDTHEETAIHDLKLVGRHPRRAAPICPVSFVYLIIILSAEVDDSVDKTEHEAICRPVNDEIDSKIIFVKRYLFGVNPIRTWTLITKLSPNRR